MGNWTLGMIAEDPASQSRHNRNWITPLVGLIAPPAPGGVAAALMSRGEIWLGYVVAVSGEVITLRLLGSNERRIVRPPWLVGCEPVRQHSWKQWSEAVERQRRGGFAGLVPWNEVPSKVKRQKWR